MVSEDPLTRPIGWWLKEADTRIERAFEAALEGTGIDRRRWQVLSSLAGRPASEQELAAALKGFDDSAVVELVVSDLVERGWVERAQDRLQLSTKGAEMQRELEARVDGMRERVVVALPRDDYVTLVHLLARLVRGFDDA